MTAGFSPAPFPAYSQMNRKEKKSIHIIISNFLCSPMRKSPHGEMLLKYCPFCLSAQEEDLCVQSGCVHGPLVVQKTRVYPLVNQLRAWMQGKSRRSMSSHGGKVFAKATTASKPKRGGGIQQQRRAENHQTSCARTPTSEAWADLRS